MAEEFLNRLNKLEEKIDGLGETLMRMITILGNVTEVKSDVRIAKEEILEEFKKMPKPVTAQPGVTKEEISEIISKLPKAESSGSGLTSEEVSQIVKGELAAILEPILESIQELQEGIHSKIDEIEVPEPVIVTTEAPLHAMNEPSVPVHPGGPLSADKGMKVADQLDNILSSLKMGCKAGDVLDVMTESKTEIMKIVPSDPIMVKIDKWAGLVNTYSSRHELQAKDILKLKKDLKDEIPKYRPA
ncbi:MAG: hypothetical protein ACFFED_12610 [Candidatus Thorarchaeota archaeon]